MARFISTNGYVELDDDCDYSIDVKSTRSRETINPKEDLSFYWKEYLVPKYGLENMNVSNCASFMKDLDMNWSKLDKPLKVKVINIFTDAIITDPDLKTDLLNKLRMSPVSQATGNNGPMASPVNSISSISSFGSQGSQGLPGKSSFGHLSNTFYIILVLLIITICVAGYFIEKHYSF